MEKFKKVVEEQLKGTSSKKKAVEMEEEAKARFKRAIFEKEDELRIAKKQLKAVTYNSEVDPFRILTKIQEVKQLESEIDELKSLEELLF